MTLWTAARQASLSITNSRCLLKLKSVESVMPSIPPSHLLSSPSPPAFNLSQNQGLFQRVSSSHQVAKVLHFSISPSNEYSELISLRINWFELLAVRGTRQSLLQFESINLLALSLLYAPTLTSLHDYWAESPK